MTSSIIKTDQSMAVTGNLVYSSVTELLKQGNQIIAQHRNSNEDDFTIDCNGIKRLDSAGISLLLEWHREFSANNKICHFVGLSDQAKSLIKAYQLESIFVS